MTFTSNPSRMDSCSAILARRSSAARGEKTEESSASLRRKVEISVSTVEELVLGGKRDGFDVVAEVLVPLAID